MASIHGSQGHGGIGVNDRYRGERFLSKLDLISIGGSNTHLAESLITCGNVLAVLVDAFNRSSEVDLLEVERDNGVNYQGGC